MHVTPLGVDMEAFAPAPPEAVDAARRDTAQTRLDDLLRDAPSPVRRTTAIVSGDPATEIARLAREHAVGAIVMALHSSQDTGRRIGSVTYRLLCQAPAVVVALPPTLPARPLPIANRASEAATAGRS